MLSKRLQEQAEQKFAESEKGTAFVLEGWSPANTPFYLVGYRQAGNTTVAVHRMGNRESVVLSSEDVAAYRAHLAVVVAFLEWDFSYH